MLGVPLTWSDIQAGITDFFSIAAANAIVAVVLALLLVGYIVSTIYSLLNGD